MKVCMAAPRLLRVDDRIEIASGVVIVVALVAAIYAFLFGTSGRLSRLSKCRVRHKEDGALEAAFVAESSYIDLGIHHDRPRLKCSLAPAQPAALRSPRWSRVQPVRPPGAAGSISAGPAESGRDHALFDDRRPRVERRLDFGEICTRIRAGDRVGAFRERDETAISCSNRGNFRRVKIIDVEDSHDRLIRELAAQKHAIETRPNVVRGLQPFVQSRQRPADICPHLFVGQAPSVVIRIVRVRFNSLA